MRESVLILEKEDGRGSGQLGSKVSQIATMFQSSDESSFSFQEMKPRDLCVSEKDSAPSHASVVRTQSHVARFNTAKALFEKMSEKKNELGLARGNRLHAGRGASISPSPSSGSSTGRVHSRSPSPGILPTSRIHSNGLSVKCTTSVQSIATISSLTISRSISPAPSLVSPSSSSVLSSPVPRSFTSSCRTLSASSSDSGEYPSIHRGYDEKGETNKEPKKKTELETSVRSSDKPKQNFNSPIKKNPHKQEENLYSRRSNSTPNIIMVSKLDEVDSRSGSNKLDPSFVSDCSSKIQSENIDSCRNVELSSKVDKADKAGLMSKPDKPAKPEILGEKRSTHQQHQELIQRHKNWFQSFSKAKSPATSPVKSEGTRALSPEGSESNRHRSIPSASGSFEIKREEEASEKKGHGLVVVDGHQNSLNISLSEKRKCQQEHVEITAHSDWRKERAAILSGRANSRHEENAKSGSKGDTVTGTFEDASTLPSSWCPPKEYTISTAKQRHSPQPSQSRTNEDTNSRISVIPDENDESNSSKASSLHWRDFSEHDTCRAGEMVTLPKRSADIILCQTEMSRLSGNMENVDKRSSSADELERAGIESQSVSLRQPNRQIEKTSILRHSFHREPDMQGKDKETTRRISSLEGDREKRLKDWEKKKMEREKRHSEGNISRYLWRRDDFAETEIVQRNGTASREVAGVGYANYIREIHDKKVVSEHVKKYENGIMKKSNVNRNSSETNLPSQENISSTTVKKQLLPLDSASKLENKIKHVDLEKQRNEHSEFLINKRESELSDKSAEKELKISKIRHEEFEQNFKKNEELLKKTKEQEELAKQVREEIEKKKKEELERKRKELEELERNRLEKEELEIKQKEQEEMKRRQRGREELERKRTAQVELQRKRKEQAELERKQKKQEELERKETEELERKCQDKVELEKRHKEQEETERRHVEQEDLERKLKEKKELDKKHKEHEEMERKQKEQAELEQKQNELEEMERKRNEQRKLKEKEFQKRKQQEEFERMRKEQVDFERKRKEQEELERMRRQEEFERKRKEQEELEMKRKEQEEFDRKRKEQDEFERKRKEQEDLERMRKQEEFERKRKEQEELEMKRKEQEEFDRKRKEQEELERKSKEQEEFERRRAQEEFERKRKEQEEFEKKRKEQEEFERKRKEQEESERKLKEQEEFERRSEQEEIERKRIEEEECERKRRKQEECERKRWEQEEFDRKKREKDEFDRKQKEQEQVERERKEHEETELNLKKGMELERKRREQEDLKIRKEIEEHERKLREEETFRKREEEELVLERKREEGRERRRMQRKREEIERLLIEKEEQERKKSIEEELEKKRREVQQKMEQEELRKIKVLESNSTLIKKGDIFTLNDICSETPMKYHEEVETEKEGLTMLRVPPRETNLDDEERERRDRDRQEIMKTKHRIAELKRERDEIRRQQVLQMQQLIDPKNSKDSVTKSAVVTVDHRTSVDTVYTGSVRQREQSQSNSIAALDALIHSPTDNVIELTQSSGEPPSESVSQDEFNQDDDLLESEEIIYDHTVRSAQHEIQFCGPSLVSDNVHAESDPMAPSSPLVQYTPSINSIEIEPLPPPIPPHNVDPASLMQENETKIVSPSNDQDADPTDLLTSLELKETSLVPDVMTAEEEEKLLSYNSDGLLSDAEGLLSDAEATEVHLLLSEQNGISSTVQIPLSEDDVRSPLDVVNDEECNPVHEEDNKPSLASTEGEASTDGFVHRAQEVFVEDGVHYLEDGHFWLEVPGLTEEDDDGFPPAFPYHKHTKLKFSMEPIQLYSTYSVNDYDRKNEDVDPVAASAEYELEKRVEKMDVFPVEIDKGETGLGLSIIGMGVGADAGVEKLGIFVKTVTAEGPTDIDGRVKVNDQIIEVDGKSLVGVTQVFAATVLKNTSGKVHFLMGREKDPENSEVAILIRQSLQADRDREERRRALEGPGYDPDNSGGIFESLSSTSEDHSPTDVPRTHFDHYGNDHEEGRIIDGALTDDLDISTHDMYGQLMDDHYATNEISLLRHHLQEAQQTNDMYEEEINILRSKLNELEKEVSDKEDICKRLHETTTKLELLQERLQSRQAEIGTYQDMLEQSQGQYVILEKKYYKAKKIIKEYQSRERDFLHREEYHCTQLEEKDSHYNSLVKALKDRVIQLEGDLMKAQQTAGLPIRMPPNQNVLLLASPTTHSPPNKRKEPPRKPQKLNTLDPDISDPETGDTTDSQDSKPSTVERKVPLKEELDVAVPPHSLLDVSASKAKGELASRGGLANRQLPSLKKTSSLSSTRSFDRSLDDSKQESQQASFAMVSSSHSIKQSTSEPIVTGNTNKTFSSSYSSHSSSSFVSSSHQEIFQHNSYSSSSSTHAQLPHTTSTFSSIGESPGRAPPPYQPPPSAHISHRPLSSQGHEWGSPVQNSFTHEGRSEIPYRNPPPVARVQPVNRVEISGNSSAFPHLPPVPGKTEHQQRLAEQLKALLAEREASGENTHISSGRTEIGHVKKSPSSLMEDVRQAVIQADASLGKKPIISGPLHLTSPSGTSGDSVVQRIIAPQKLNASSGSSLHQRIHADSGSWSPRTSQTSIQSVSSSSGVVLLSQRPIDSSLPLVHKGEIGLNVPEECSGSQSLKSLDEGSKTSLDISSPTTAICDWNKEQVAQWLMLQGLESCISKFISSGITGPRLINLDTKDLKNLGLSTEEKSKIKRKVKDLRLNLEKERKQVEKEKKERERLQKKAEKLADKAEKRRK